VPLSIQNNVIQHCFIQRLLYQYGFIQHNDKERDMHKHWLIAFSLLLFASAAMAESKVDTKWHCSKAAAEYKLDVGDVPDHIYWIGQGTCEATSNTGGLKEKSGTFTEFHDAWKTSFTYHGRYNATLEDGDKIYYTYEGSGSPDPTKPVANKWKVVGGTGKYKGIKGSGSCAGTVNADGSVDLECTGAVSMAMSKTAGE
jgi:hypothetical protein